ncbi:putative reverse transcriptase domain-containing protein [Tanacetum coccineum]
MPRPQPQPQPQPRSQMQVAEGKVGPPPDKEVSTLGRPILHQHPSLHLLLPFPDLLPDLWFEKTEMVFGISECAEARKVKFVAATLQGRALTWWNSQVATIGLEAANQIGWTEMRRLMTEEFCPIEEIQRMEHELWNLKVKDFDITAYTKRFHELAQLCPEMVPTEAQARIERIAEGNKRKWESSQGGNNGHMARDCKGKAMARRGVLPRPTMTCYEMYEDLTIDSVNTSFSHLIDINPVRLDTSYEVELAR